jgi:hypothetical protein
VIPRAILRRTLISAIAIMIVAPVAPAAADPAEPTDYRSVVDAVEPAIAGVTIDVVGGDSFLRVRAEPGHEVVVIGYWDEPYARITADGTVEINESSPSVLQNERRYGVATEQPIDTTQPPRWETIGTGGELMWHDHRSHWMAPTKPTVGSDGLVQRWDLPLVVDGRAVVVRGSLYVHASPTPLWWLLVVPALAGAVIAAAHRPLLVAAIGATVTVIGVIDRISLPAAARPAWVAVALSGLAAVAGIASAVRRRTWWAAPVLAGGAAALAIAGYMERAAIGKAFVPGPTPDWLARVLAVCALGTGMVVFATAVLTAIGVRFDLLLGRDRQRVGSGP